MKLITIGRASTNDLIINDKDSLVSGQHAELIVNDDGTMYIRDKGSTNHTFVNGKEISPGTDISVNKSDNIRFANVMTLDWSRVESYLKSIEDLQRIYKIGRDKENDIVLMDSKNLVSGSHAIIEVMKNGDIYLTDNSKNGTSINGVTVSNQRRQIKRGDSIVFAKTASLDWNKIESVSTSSKQKTKKKSSSSVSKKIGPIISIAAALIISFGIYYYRCQIFDCNYSVDEISENYGSSVVWVHHEYYLTVNLKSEGNKEQKTIYWIGLNKDNPNEVIYINYIQKETFGIENYLQPFVASGTGFMISNDGKVISNRHLIFPYKSYESRTLENYYNNPSIMDKVSRAMEEAKESFEEFVEIELDQSSEFLAVAMNGKQLNDREDMYKAHALTYSDDLEADLAVMQLKEKDLSKTTNINYIDLSKNIETGDLPIGKELVVIGFPHSKELNLRDVNYNKKMVAMVQAGKLNSAPEKYRIQYSMTTAHGASGSPVFDLKGNLVAVNYAYFTADSDAPNSIANFGIRSSHIENLMKKIHSQ